MNSEEIAQTTQTGGNTETPVLEGKRHRKWCFTLNNYTEIEITQIHKNFKKYYYGKEVGDKGTPHLQGYIELKDGKSLLKMKKLIPRAHLEVAKGNLEQNKKYCGKDGIIVSTFPLNRIEKALVKYKDVVWKEWQANIIKIVDGPISSRKIYWFYETTGNVGKSFLTKYLLLKYNAIIADGKKADVFNQVKTWLDVNEEEDPLLCIIDIPRASFNNISYSAIEKIQDGLLYSGKYEGGVCVFETPHIIIFANEEPDTSKCSEDRWEIYEL